MIDLIPAIDLIEGKCVRLTQGDFDRKTIYDENPVEVAQRFQDAGVKRLHLVDLDGAREGKVTNQKVLEKIAVATDLFIDFGGGINKEEDVRSVFSAGASMAAIGSVAAKKPETFLQWVKTFGAEKFFVGADTDNEKIAVRGWQERTEISVFDFIKKMVESGVRNIFCTEISKDGMMKGPADQLYQKILEQFTDDKPLLVASGGIRSLKDVDLVQQAGCGGAIVGKAIYEGKITMNEIRNYINK